ncbi:MAG TPA: hypothetical protein VGM44_05845 [Polyangiaceae bacterium]
MRIVEKACFGFGLSLLGCAANHASEPVAPPHSAQPKPAPSVPAGTPRLNATSIAKVPAGTFGPYLGMSAHGGVAVWAAAESAARGWYTHAFTAAGASAGDAARIGDAPNELGLVSVRALREGFALLSTHRVSDGEVVEVTLLSDRGLKLAGPTDVGHAANGVLWVEAIPNSRGAAILWAASSGGHAELWTAEINAKAELAESARLLARDAGAWQAVAFGKGFALGVTHVGKASGAHGPIDVSLVNEAGVASTPILVNAEASADLDLDLAAIGDNRDELVLAWSDHRGSEGRVFSAALDQSGKIVSAAAPATPPLGEQAMLRIAAPASGSGRGYLAWEAVDAQTPVHRTFQVAEFRANGRVTSPRGLFEYWKMDGSTPEIAASPNGVAVLTLAPVCERSVECTKSGLVAPEFVEFDASLSPRATEPVWPLGETNPASLAWNLTCPSEVCFTLSAESGTESRVSLTRLEHRSDVYRAPAERVELPPPPRIVGDEALAETAPLAQIALTETNAGTLLGWITDFDPTTPWVKLKKPTADGRYEPLRARIDLQAFAGSEPFAALDASENLSLRAHSLGGIALSSSSHEKDALTAWAGLDNGQPQVFLTLVDKVGKKQAQRMLTHKNGELSDIALLQSGSDYFVAWVDERNSDPEVYATKVNHALNRIAPEERITQAPGAATDVSLVSTAGGPLAIWADARDTETPGAADIYAAALRSNDAARVAPEIPLQKTRPHSFSPSARAYGKNALVAWLEAAAESGEDQAAHVCFAVVDGTGHVVGAVQNVALPAGTPSTLGLDCSETTCHAVISADDGAHNSLYAVSFQNEKASNPVRIRSVPGAGSSVAPVLHGRELYVADAQQSGTRVRRLLLDW